MDNYTWNRRKVLKSLSLGAIAGKELLTTAARVAVAASPARCTVLNHRGEPLKPEEFARFYICDLMMRPFTISPQFELGEAVFQAPEKPFRIALPMTVPGFGQVFVYADNRGRGYTAQSFFEKPLFLNYEFAVDRLATVTRLLEESKRSGITISADARGRADKAKALLDKAEGLSQNRRAYVEALMVSLCESIWAGEMIVTERADQLISGQSPRPGFLFGCNAFAYTRYGKPYADQFEAVFNYATLPFYRGTVERVQGKPDYSRTEKLLEWLRTTDIVLKGHPLIFYLEAGTPKWMRDLPFEQTKKLLLGQVQDAILKFRNRIHVWDVINEAHVQPDAGGGSKVRGYTKEQTAELTRDALKAARGADPTCFRIVNCTGTWCDYYMGRNPYPWQQTVSDYLTMIEDMGAEYEALGLQYYHSGRDLLEFERNLETFKGFGKPIHLTELGIASSSEAPENTEWWGGGIDGSKMLWRGETFTEETQAQWVEGMYTIAFSKPYIEALTWWDMSDPAFIPNGGFIREDCTPKPSYQRLRALQTKWRNEGILSGF